MYRAGLPLFVALSATVLTAEALASAPVLNMVLGTKKGRGVRTVSLVENPAIEVGWVALSATEPQAPTLLHLSEEADAQIVTGPALIPDKKILRIDPKTKSPYYIQFTAAQIREIARRFAQEGHHNSTNEAHSVALSGNVVEESWIVADPEKDKVATLGIDVPAGTWMLGMHVPDADTWQKIKDGQLTGFSIEGLFDPEELTLAAVAAPQPMKRNWFTAMAFKLAAAAGIKLTQTELKDGTIVDVAEDGTVSSLDADGNITGPAPDGEYELPDGTKLVVKDGKKVEPAKEGAAGGSEASKEMKMAGEGDTATAASELQKAIDLHKKHMDGTAPTDEASQQAMMDLMEKALAALGKPDAGTETNLSAVEPEALKLAAVNLFLEAVEMADGRTFQYNPITRRLTDDTGKVVETGEYACADGTYFRCSTDQWTSQISKADYDKGQAANTALSAAETKVLSLEAALAATPAGVPVALGGDGGHQSGAGQTGTKPLPVWMQSALSRAAELKQQAN